LLSGFNIVGISLSGIVADRWSSRKILCFLYAVRALSIVILIYSQEPYLLLAFAILFGLVDFATVAPTQILATQYFQNYSIGLMIGWLSLAHQIGSALGAYVPGVIYTVTGEYTLAFYLSIGMLVLASVMNVMLREPAAVTRDSASVVEK
ncbi:MFS transporter, partial [Bacillus velezensis]|uniref:MFS transporter n=1 Tax=Bacillus velezensis TaxID=492670 RepID=UPI00102E69A1